MKNAFFCLLILSLCFACTKKKETVNTPIVEKLAHDDSLATVDMSYELSMMHESLDSLLASPHHDHQLHWDSLYHAHDSLFWYHHNAYHHETYTHDDHHHEWVPYDSTIDHSHHFHHHYVGHEHDSLITTHNAHTHDNGDHHFHGHDYEHHHLLDSLHLVHNQHHP